MCSSSSLPFATAGLVQNAGLGQCSFTAKLNISLRTGLASPTIRGRELGDPVLGPCWPSHWFTKPPHPSGCLSESMGFLLLSLRLRQVPACQCHLPEDSIQLLFLSGHRDSELQGAGPWLALRGRWKCLFSKAEVLPYLGYPCRVEAFSAAIGVSHLFSP